MAMTVEEAQRILQQVSPLPNPQDGTDLTDPPSGGGGSGGDSSLTLDEMQKAAYAGYNTTSADGRLEYKLGLPPGTLSSARQLNESGLTPTVTSGLLGFDGAASSGGKQVKTVNGRVYVFDPNTGEFVDSGLSDPSGSGSSNFDTGPGYLSLAQQKYGSDEDQRAIDNAIGWQQLLNSQKYQDRNYAMETRGQDASILGDRAASGQQTAGLARGLANDQYQRANSPANFPAYLAALSGADTGGNPVNQLLGEGFQIESGEGQNPLTDPRFQQLLESLYSYGTAPSPENVGAVRSQYETNPNAQQGFENFAAFDRLPKLAGGGLLGVGGGQGFSDRLRDMSPKLGGQAMADSGWQSPDPYGGQPGGTQFTGKGPTGVFGGQPMVPNMNLPQMGSTPGPVTINDAASQKPLAMAGEAGRETLSVTPNSGNTYTPATGTATSLGKALQPLGFIPPQVIQQLLAGKSATPNMFNEEQLMRLPPSLRQLLQASIRAFIGDTGLEDFGASQQQFALPGGRGGGEVSH